MDFFSTLPTETKQIVVSFGDKRCKRMLRATSTAWFNLINYSDFTIYFARSSTLPDVVKTLSRHKNSIGLHFVKQIGLFDYSCYTILGSLQNLTRLEIDPHSGIDYGNRRSCDEVLHYTNLTALKILNLPEISVGQHCSRFPTLTNLELKLQKGEKFDGEELTNLTHLQRFLFVDQYSRFPKKDILSNLGNPTALTELILIHYDAPVDDGILAKLSNVSKLELNYGSTILYHKLPNLESLQLLQKHVHTVHLDLEFNTRLKTLMVDCAPLPPCPSLSAMVNLRHLEIKFFQEDEHLTFLRALTALEYLDLSFMKHRTGQYLEFINSPHLTKLSTESLSSMQYFSHITTLYDLYFSDPDELPPDYTSANLQLLTRLVTSASGMSRGSYPNLKYLTVRYPEPAEQDRYCLSSLTTLESLILQSSDVPLESLIGLTNLTQLRLPAYTLDEEPPESICNVLNKLTNLESLVIMTYTDECLEAILRLTRLTMLDIVTRELIGCDESKFSVLTNLQRLHLTTSSPEDKQHECKLNLPYLYNHYADF